MHENHCKTRHGNRAGQACRLLLLSLMLAAFAAGCASKSVAEWMSSARYIEELHVPYGCSIAAENLEKALALRRDGTLLPFGGEFSKVEPEGKECGRFILHSALSDSPSAIITLERRGDGDTGVTVYQQTSGTFHSRQFVATVERWASGFIDAE